MRAEIIAVGTEIILGDIVNTNTAFLARELAALGFDMHYQSVVGDNPEKVIEATRNAIRRSHVIIFTGGLGPTDDDLTREAVAATCGLKLVTDEVTKARIDEFFRCRHQGTTPNNYKQAKVFEEGEVLQNENGTAPGLYCKKGNQVVILLPGPPSELEPLFYAQVAPRLKALFSGTIHSKTLHVFGIGEGALEDTLGEALSGSNPTAALYAKTGEVYIRITAKADTEAHAEELCEQKAREIRGIIHEHIYSEDGASLAEVVVNRLKQERKKIAVAESITGGLVSGALTDVAGSSAVLEYSAVAYSNHAKNEMLGVPESVLNKYTAVSAECAAIMASAVRQIADADVGLATTGYAGPEGEPVGLVFVAVAAGDSISVKKLELGGHRSRDFVRALVVKHALDLVRRASDSLDISGAQTIKDIFTFARRDGKLVLTNK